MILNFTSNTSKCGQIPSHLQLCFVIDQMQDLEKEILWSCDPEKKKEWTDFCPFQSAMMSESIGRNNVLELQNMK